MAGGGWRPSGLARWWCGGAPCPRPIPDDRSLYALLATLDPLSGSWLSHSIATAWPRSRPCGQWRHAGREPVATDSDVRERDARHAPRYRASRRWQDCALPLCDHAFAGGEQRVQGCDSPRGPVVGTSITNVLRHATPLIRSYWSRRRTVAAPAIRSAGLCHGSRAIIASSNGA